jgi:hypothetical protein
MYIFKFILLIYLRTSESGTPFIFVFGYIILTNPELEVFVVKYSLTSESGILQANYYGIHQQTFSNLRQNQQCSLSQAGRLKNNNIFLFT